MDQLLRDCLTRLEAQGNALGRARNDYLRKEAVKRHFEATLVKKALGSSNAEKLVNAQAEKDWLLFHVQLARLEAIYEFQKLKFQVMEKEWLGEYATYKEDSSLIKRQET